jgi:ABC-type dipeptide/oligopeptide/nickel transport system permease subunit
MLVAEDGSLDYVGYHLGILWKVPLACALLALFYATIAVGTFISAEAALTYLGIGLQAPEISWGLQINVAQSLILL